MICPQLLAGTELYGEAIKAPLPAMGKLFANVTTKCCNIGKEDNEAPSPTSPIDGDYLVVPRRGRYNQRVLDQWLTAISRDRSYAAQ
jgi:hypothetical protein